MRADKSKFKEQRRPDSLSGTATGSLHEQVNHPVSVKHLSLAQEPFLLQPCVSGEIFGMRKSVASGRVSVTRSMALSLHPPSVAT